MENILPWQNFKGIKGKNLSKRLAKFIASTLCLCHVSAISSFTGTCNKEVVKNCRETNNTFEVLAVACRHLYWGDEVELLLKVPAGLGQTISVKHRQLSQPHWTLFQEAALAWQITEFIQSRQNLSLLVKANWIEICLSISWYLEFAWTARNANCIYRETADFETNNSKLYCAWQAFLNRWGAIDRSCVQKGTSPTFLQGFKLE